jgi:hypothetical protein
MGWIFLAASEESLKPWMATSSLSPIVRTTDTLKLSFCRVCGIEAFHVPLSGMTRGHSMRDIYPFCPISFTEDFLVKTSPLPDAERAWAASAADYFSRSSDSSARYDRDSSSWRTSQRLLFEEQSELLGSFAASGMTVDGAFYPLVMWERITKEKGGGSLPSDGQLWMTPKAGNCGMTARTKGRPLNRSTHLQAQVHCEEKKMWPTPCGPNSGGTHGKAKLKKMLWRTPQASNANQGPKSEELFNKCMETGQSMITLVDQVKMWPTPTANDNDNRRSKPTPAEIEGRHGWSLMSAIRDADTPAPNRTWPTPTARAGQNPGEHGQGGQNLATVAGGQLNPEWVEWLMGYPCGWTVLEDWATLWFRPKRGKRSSV